MHELLTERRDEDVELADLIDRLRAMLVQGVGGGKEVSAELEPVSLPSARATALALVFSELLQNALEHGGDRVRVELARRDGEVVLAIADDGSGVGAVVAGTGLSIVQALVRDELRGHARPQLGRAALAPRSCSPPRGVLDAPRLDRAGCGRAGASHATAVRDQSVPPHRRGRLRAGVRIVRRQSKKRAEVPLPIHPRAQFVSGGCHRTCLGGTWPNGRGCVT